MVTLAIGCDHAGYDLKQFIKAKLHSLGYTVTDFGTFSNDSVDYPDIVHPLASAVDKQLIERGIIICGTGIGVSMVANKYPGIRAALCWMPEIALLARKHNDANVLALPGRFISNDIAWEVVTAFLDTPFEEGRHQRRVDKIARI